ncbi:hypothetical protein CMK18_20545, partial [Candidatus Poribacteria bacterium]|nr:hypothetical protein [Candidatus Poribacteria bacterium]
MTANLNLYIPGRPSYIYYNGKCYRKTEDRTYDNGTLFDESEVDRTSTTKTQFNNSGKAVWVQRSCEECSDPGGIQMISIDWMTTTIAIQADIHSLTNPNLGSAFYSIEPLRTGNYVKGADDHDGDGVDDSVIGPGMLATVTVEQGDSASFADIFGAITPIKFGVTPPEAGRTDPLSAMNGFYQIENDTTCTVDIVSTGMEILPGHKDFDYAGNTLDMFHITGRSKNAGGLTVGVTVEALGDSRFTHAEYDPSPTAPLIHEDHNKPAFFAINPVQMQSPTVMVTLSNFDKTTINNVNGSDRGEGGVAGVDGAVV